jgi:hypothetical protein
MNAFYPGKFAIPVDCNFFSSLIYQILSKENAKTFSLFSLNHWVDSFSPFPAWHAFQTISRGIGGQFKFTQRSSLYNLDENSCRRCKQTESPAGQ